MAKLSIRNLDLLRKIIFLRVDYNVPLADGGKTITSDKRIVASLPTIQYALNEGAGLVLASHLGRPKGKPNAELSMQPIAKRLEQLLGRPVQLAPDCIGPEVRSMRPAPGEVVLLENLRFHLEEEKNEREFARELARMSDVYVDDAFGAAHRAHASTVGIIEFLPEAAAGLLMERELTYLTKVTQNPERPSVALIGGAKVSDKIEVIRNLLRIVDKLLIGGAMAYTFLKSKGESIGKSLVEDDKLDLARELMEEFGTKLILPVDHIVVDQLAAGAPSEAAETIGAGKIAVDIGPRTIQQYSEILRTAKTIIWNGPMGVFEMKPFDTGTVALAKVVADSGATSVVGGGDSEKAIKAAGVSDRISHISTGGGASLEFLSGLTLPGVAALKDR